MSYRGKRPPCSIVSCAGRTSPIEPPGNRTLIGGLRIHGSTVELEALGDTFPVTTRKVSSRPLSECQRTIRRIYLGCCSPFRRTPDRPATAILRDCIHFHGDVRTRTGLAPRRRVYSPPPSLTVNVPIPPSSSGRRDSNPCLEAGNLAIFQAELRPHPSSPEPELNRRLWCTRPPFFRLNYPGTHLHGRRDSNPHRRFWRPWAYP